MFIELPLNDHWIAIEWSLNCNWIFIELPLNDHWISIEWSLNCRWMIIELPLNDYWIALNCHWILLHLACHILLNGAKLCISPLSFMVLFKTSHRLPSVQKRHPLLFSSPPCIRAWTYTMVVLYKYNCYSQFDFNLCCCSILVYASLEQLQHALVQITCIQNKSHKQMNIWTVLNLNKT